MGPRLVAPLGLGDPRRLESRGTERLGYRRVHRMELVIPGQLLDQRPPTLVLEHDEMANQIEKATPFADAFDHHLQLRDSDCRKRLPTNGAPGLEPLPAGGQSADTGFEAVGNDEKRVVGEECGQLGLVGLELLEGGPDGGVLVGGILKLHQAEWQTVDEEHDVGTADMPVLFNGELIHGEPVVLVGGVEIEHAGLGAADGAVLGPVLDRHAVYEQTVEMTVAGFEGGTFWAGQLPGCLVERIAGEGWVEPRQGVVEAAVKHNLAVVGTLGPELSRCDIGPVCNLPPEASQPVEGRILDHGLGELPAHCCGGPLDARRPSTTSRSRGRSSWIVRQTRSRFTMTYP